MSWLRRISRAANDRSPWEPDCQSPPSEQTTVFRDDEFRVIAGSEWLVFEFFWWLLAVMRLTVLSPLNSFARSPTTPRLRATAMR